MDEVSRPASERPSRSLDEQQNSLAAPPRRAASGASSDDAGSAAVARRTVGGRAVTIPPPPAAAAATAAFPGVGWTNEDISPQGAPLHTVAASSASSAAAAGDVIDVDDGDEDEYSYFGEFPNPDPTDDSPLDISNSFTHLFVNSNKCSREYSKSRKIQILYDVLSVDKSVLLGDSPPRRVERIFLAYRQNVRGRSRWKVKDIAGPIYILGKFVTERLKASTGRGRPNSKMEALSVMYLFYMQEIAHEDERRRSATEATRKAAKSSKATNPLPPDFVFNPNKVADFNCPLCQCVGTVVKMDDPKEIKKQQNEYERDFLKKVKEYEKTTKGNGNGKGKGDAKVAVGSRGQGAWFRGPALVGSSRFSGPVHC